MAFMSSLRNRFESDLHSHQIDEDYTTPSRRSLQNNRRDITELPEIVAGDYDPQGNGGLGTPGSVAHSHSLAEVFDPNEAVPSYETSQLLHERRLDLETPNTPTRSNSIDDITSLAPPPPPQKPKLSLKQLGLKFLNARQHFALAFSRDVSLVPPMIGLFQLWKRVFFDNHQVKIDTVNSIANNSQHLQVSITSARLSEHFLTGVWCVVAGYLSFSVLDGLIIRWIVIYLTPAAIVRVLSMSAIMITAEQYLVSTFSADGYKYGLHIWILISCCLTITYGVQNFVTSNLDLKKGGRKRARFFDFYNIAVFAVVPVGLASFITMIGLLRSLLILRIDIDQSRRAL